MIRSASGPKRGEDTKNPGNADEVAALEHSCTAPWVDLSYCRAMITYGEVGRIEKKVRESYWHSLRLAVVLSLTLSLAGIAVIAKGQPSYPWVILATLIAPIFLVLYFRRRIAPLGPFIHVGILLALLGAGILFGL